MADGWDIARIRTESGDANAHFVDGPVKASVYARQEDGRSVYGPLRVRRALAVGGLFLIETDDEPDNWYMGQMAKDGGSIECWGSYGPLPDAIRGL